MGVISLAKKLVYCVLIKEWIIEDNLCHGCNLCFKRLEIIKKILEKYMNRGSEEENE
jgi:MinD superfamily P-loop ATPase